MFVFIGFYGQKISGICVDNRSGKPIEYVMVGVEGVNVGVVTDSQGRFEFDIPA